MFERLDQARSLTGNQLKIVTAAIIGDMLEFFDYFLIGFVLAFIIKPWGLTFGQSAIILLSSGIGAILGAFIWGRIADVVGRRRVFVGTVINFSIATGDPGVHPGPWLDLPHGVPLLRRFRRGRTLLRGPAAGAGVRAQPHARLHRRHRHRVHPARRDDRLGARRFPGARDRLARPVRCRPGARPVHPGDPRLGAGIAALAAEPGPAARKHAARSPGRCRCRRSRCRSPPQQPGAAAHQHGPICSSTRAAWRCPGWRASARRPPAMASACGDRHCSCCNSA